MRMRMTSMRMRMTSMRVRMISWSRMSIQKIQTKALMRMIRSAFNELIFTLSPLVHIFDI
jgi:hypothetical protein